MMNITTQTRKIIRSTLIAGLAVMSLMTSSAFATNHYCNEAKFKQVYAYSDYTYDTHLHFDVACPYNYQAISCEFDFHGRNDDGGNQYFIAVNDASPYRFDDSHNGYQLEGEYGCHFRANNFKAYFPGYDNKFEWRMKGWATCVPTDCVYVDETHDDYNESQDATWFPEWD